MAHDSTGISAIGGLSYSLMSRQLRRDDVADVVMHRLGDVRKDKVEGRVDKFVRNRQDDDQTDHERIYNALRQLADRYKTSSAQSATAPTPATDDAAPTSTTPSLATLSTSAPALVVSLSAPAPATATADTSSSGTTTTSTDTSTTSSGTTTTSSGTTTTSGTSGGTTTSGSTTTSNGKSGTAPGQNKP
jgi:hypothetical protein